MIEKTVTDSERLQEIVRLLPLWKDKTVEQIIAELISFGTETKRIPDKYTFKVLNNSLYSPITEKPIEESIKKKGYPEGKEYEAFLKIQDFSVENNEGTSIWISPEFSMVYPSSKIIISTLGKDEKGKKILKNTSVTIGLNKRKCLEIFNLISVAKKLYDPEDLRQNPIFLDSEISKKWMQLFVNLDKQFSMEISNEQIVSEYNIAGQIIYNLPTHMDYRYQASYILYQAKENSLLGNFPTSCGGSNKNNLKSAVNVFKENSLSLNETAFDCPKCHRPIPAGKGIMVCPHCGARKEDYFSCV